MEYDTWCSRITGLVSPTGSVSRWPVTWLPSEVGSAVSSSTLSGTIARILVLGVTGSARVSSQARSAPVTTVSTTSFTVQPCADRTAR